MHAWWGYVADVTSRKFRRSVSGISLWPYALVYVGISLELGSELAHGLASKLNLQGLRACLQHIR